jgi:hypothetical protein
MQSSYTLFENPPVKNIWDLLSIGKKKNQLMIDKPVEYCYYICNGYIDNGYNS